MSRVAIKYVRLTRCPVDQAMTVYTPAISESFPLIQSVSKNLHTLKIADVIIFIESPSTQHKFLMINQTITLNEDLNRNVTLNLGINQSLSFTQTQYPRVRTNELAEVFAFEEFLNKDNIVERLIFIETKTVDKSKLISENIDFDEVLTTNRYFGLAIDELINLAQTLSGQHNDLGILVADQDIIIEEDSMREVPSGTINGSNTDFVLSEFPVQISSLQVYKNGLLMNIGGGNDYTYNVSTKTITFLSGAIPISGDTLIAYYWI